MKIIRLLISSALLVLLLLIAYGIALTWKWDPMAQIKNKPEKAKKDSAVSAPLAAIRFNPVPPAVLPELNTNYIFSETRTAGIKKEDELTGKTTVGVNIKEAYYVGSIIVGNVPKGMIAYAAGAAAPVGQQAGQGLTRTGGSGMKQMLVEAGDNLGGYTVAEIQADRIVFKKASEIVEKFLKDPDKKRTAAAPQPAAAAGKQAASSKIRNIGGGDDAAGKSAKQAPTPPPPQQQSQPAKMSTRVPAAAQAKNAPTPPPAVPPIVAPHPPGTAPAPVPVPPPPTEARQMTPEEIQEMEKEAASQPEQEETETEQ